MDMEGMHMAQMLYMHVHTFLKNELEFRFAECFSGSQDIFFSFSHEIINNL